MTDVGQMLRGFVTVGACRSVVVKQACRRVPIAVDAVNKPRVLPPAGLQVSRCPFSDITLRCLLHSQEVPMKKKGQPIPYITKKQRVPRAL
eukprot:857740-Amphidinium_carterae.1